MNKIEALNYLADNGIMYDEWSTAGLCDVLISIIRSEDITFSIEYLDELIKIAEKY